MPGLGQQVAAPKPNQNQYNKTKMGAGPGQAGEAQGLTPGTPAENKGNGLGESFGVHGVFLPGTPPAPRLGVTGCLGRCSAVLSPGPRGLSSEKQDAQPEVPSCRRPRDTAELPVNQPPNPPPPLLHPLHLGLSGDSGPGNRGKKVTGRYSLVPNSGAWQPPTCPRLYPGTAKVSLPQPQGAAGGQRTLVSLVCLGHTQRYSGLLLTQELLLCRQGSDLARPCAWQAPSMLSYPYGPSESL